MEFMGVPIHGTTPEIVLSIIASLVTIFTFLGYQGHVLENHEKQTPLNEFPPIPLWCFMLNNTIWLMLAAADILLNDATSGNNVVPKASHVMYLLCSSGLAAYYEWFYIFIYGELGPVIKNRTCTELLYIFAIFSAFTFASGIVLYVRPICFVIGIITGIAVYASPLVIIIKCHKEESVEGLPIRLCYGLFLNGISWSSAALVAYKGAKFDVFLLVTNGIGAFLGLLQLGIIYRLRNLSLNKIHADQGSV